MEALNIGAMSEKFFSERFNTPTGWMRIITDAEHRLRSADWEDKGDRMCRLLRLHYGDDLELLPACGDSRARLALEAYFEGDLRTIEMIDTRTCGTHFQQRVWAALREIPCGTTVSYGQLATLIGKPAAVRAVGAANGANPIPIVVPCHRVIGADASLTGFGGGLERKRWLLAHERRHSSASAPYNLELIG
jgi:methylated-DNA-[protein]-cysteine S-methyltransferase